ncbi:hypothetical protein Q3G72_007357 [Acer saccharum]|nr:hypothetical protein Q3G72_007357 [Acer saccharum]
MDYGPPIALPLHQEDALQTSIRVLNLETHLSGKKRGRDPEIASSAKKAKQQKSETSTPHPRLNQNHHPNHHHIHTNPETSTPNHHQIHPNHHQIHTKSTQITTKPHPNHFSPHTSEERKREREKDEGCGGERRRRRRPVRRKEMKTKAAAAEGEEGEGRGGGRRRRRRPRQWKEMKAKAGAAVLKDFSFSSLFLAAYGLRSLSKGRSKHGKTVDWTSKDLLKALEEFVPIKETHPIKNNMHGMGFDHSFGLWFITRWLKPDLMIESGAFKGKYLQKGPAYVDANCTYYAGKEFVDFSSVDWARGGHSCFEARIRARRKKFWEKAVDVQELCGPGETWWGVKRRNAK